MVDQGVPPGTYQVAVADAVLHITTDKAQNLRNTRKALQPGGTLLLREILESWGGWTVGFVFGVFPGW